MARAPALLAAAALQLGLASAQLGCLTRVTHVHYESVAAIDMVEFFYRDDSSELYDADGSGPSENDYAKHGRIVVPCDRYIRSVSWTDFASHGWQGRELDYSLADASGQEVSTVEQAAGYAPDCVDDEWAQNSMGGCLDPVVFDAPAGEAIVGLVWDGSGVLTGITSEPLPPPDSTAPLRSESTPIALSGFTLDGSATVDGEILKLTGVENSQTGTAFYPLWVHGTSGSEAITLRFEMYVGDGSGADGMCVNVGGNNLWALDYSAQRNAEDGIANGLALCFDGTRSSSLLVFLQSLKEAAGRMGQQRRPRRNDLLRRGAGLGESWRVRQRRGLRADLAVRRRDVARGRAQHLTDGERRRRGHLPAHHRRRPARHSHHLPWFRHDPGVFAPHPFVPRVHRADGGSDEQPLGAGGQPRDGL